MGKRLDETILHGIERIGLVAEKPKRDAIGGLAVAPKKLFERASIPRCEATQQLLIAGRRRAVKGDGGHNASRTPTTQTKLPAEVFMVS
jgi:hypothetical protein